MAGFQLEGPTPLRSSMLWKLQDTFYDKVRVVSLGGGLD